MDGYEACQRIDDFYADYVDRPPIYALTADVSEKTEQMISTYPFTCKFEKLDEGTEMLQIL
jgi:CheY-like chemotaxis protein